MLADTDAQEGDWVVARTQTAGRGRQGRTWQSVDGNFFGSTLVVLKPGDRPATTLALAAGLALIETVDEVAPARSSMLKWPNDLMLNGAKLAGILLERSGDRVVAGFGVNLAASPWLEGRRVADLGAIITPEEFATRLAAATTRLVGLWRSTPAESFSRAWQERAHPLGSDLTVHVSPGQVIRGKFSGIEPDGALRLLLDEGGEQVIRAGDLILG